MTTLNNPFVISGYVGPEYFCDRENECTVINDALHNGRNVTLIAPRRMGKTGLICHTFHRLKEINPEIVTLYMDIYATKSLGDFVRLFASTVLGRLDSAPQKALSRIREFIQSCIPVISFDEITGVPKVTIDVEPSKEESTLKEIFDYLASSQKRCYIAIDEFQQIADYPESCVEALLRSYIQFLPNVNFIFAGSKQHIMAEMFTSSKRPFYQSTQTLSIDAIDREKYAKFAIGFFEENGHRLPKEVFDEIYNRFEGYTWYVQNLLNRLYGYHKDIDSELVSFAIQQLITELSDSYSALLNLYSDGNVRLLRAIARELCVKEVTSSEFLRKYRLGAASSVHSSLKKLVDNELIYRTSNGYIIYDRLMSQWLRSLPF